MRTITLGVLILTLWGSASAIAQLPPEIRADSYLLRAEQAIGEGDQARTRDEIGKIILLERAHELDLADEFHFRYAKAADMAGMPEQAHEAVVKYLTAAGRGGRHYVEALELMNKVQDAIEASKEPREASNEPTPQAQEASQIPATDQLGAGRTPDRQEARVGSEVPSPHPVVERKFADCKQWGEWNWDYFRAATVADVVACLDAGADPNAPDELKVTVLHWAARYNGNPRVVQALLAAGASLEARDVGKETPLHWAAVSNQNPEVVQALLAAGANPNARNEKGKWPEELTKRKEERRMLAAARRTGIQKGSGGGGLGVLIGTATAVGVGTASGASTEAILAGVEAAAAGQQAATGGRQQTAAGSSSGIGGGSCEIPGYPNPPGGVANLGLSWCPASVSMQARAFALQAAGAQCAIATGSSSTPEQIQARRREITVACGRLAALGAPNCQCPAGLGGPGSAQDSSSILQEEEPDLQAEELEAQWERQKKRALQAALTDLEAEKRGIEAANAEVLDSDCQCIRIEYDGKYTCIDGSMPGNIFSGKSWCDIRQ